MTSMGDEKTSEKPQAAKFRDLAKEAECEDNEAAFDKKLERIAEAKKKKPRHRLKGVVDPRLL